MAILIDEYGKKSCLNFDRKNRQIEQCGLPQLRQQKPRVETAPGKYSFMRLASAAEVKSTEPHCLQAHHFQRRLFEIARPRPSRFMPICTV